MKLLYIVFILALFSCKSREKDNNSLDDSAENNFAQLSPTKLTVNGKGLSWSNIYFFAGGMRQGKRIIRLGLY